MNNPILDITSPLAAAVISVDVQPGDLVFKDQPLVSLESMKMQTLVIAPEDAVVKAVLVANGDTIQAGQILFELECAVAARESTETAEQVAPGEPASGNLLEDLQTQLAYSSGRTASDE